MRLAQFGIPEWGRGLVKSGAVCENVNEHAAKNKPISMQFV